MLRFNFVETKEVKLKKFLVPELIISILIIVVFLVGVQVQILSLDKEISHFNKEIRRLKAEESRFKRIEREEERQLVEKKRVIRNKLRIITELDRKRKVPAFLYYFGKRENVDPGVWLYSIDKKGNRLVIKGGALNLSLISSFLSKIEKNLGRVVFKSTELVLGKSSKVNYYKFQFTVEMK